MDDGRPDDHPDFEGVVSMSEILTLTREEAAKVVGVKAWDLAKLASLVNDAIASTPEAPAKPPSIFVSYRWDSPEHKDWVARLAGDLVDRGYDVYFDQTLQDDHDDQLAVPDLISMIARCNRFLIIWTDGYRRRVVVEDERGTLQDGWAWDEYQTALHLANIGRLKSWLIVWRSGELPSWVDEDDVWDFRADDEYEDLIEQAFPRRMARIVGVRADRTARVVGPIERTQIEVYGRRMEAEEAFDHFVIEHL